MTTGGVEEGHESNVQTRSVPRYSIASLLSLRKSAAPVQLDFVPEFEDEQLDADQATKRPEMLFFRKVVKRPNEIKFHCDMDVPTDHIVHVSGLDRAVEWPHLSTFCSKTVGVKPLDIRMMRRQKPAQARLIFRSSEEAALFVTSVPLNARLKGCVPRFCLGTDVPKGSNFKDCFAAMPVPAKDVADCSAVATAVLWDSKAAEFKTAVAEVEEDDCCCKGKTEGKSMAEPAMAMMEVAKGLVESAVPLAEPSAKLSKGGGRSKQAQKHSKAGKGPNRTKSVTAICVAHMPTRLAVDM